MCDCLTHTHPTGDLACNPGICPYWKLNCQPFGLQAGTQSTEPHQPGQIYDIFEGSSTVDTLCSQMLNLTSFPQKFSEFHLQVKENFCKQWPMINQTNKLCIFVDIIRQSTY